MSIRGIDAQIMVTRAAELVRDTSVQLKGSERMQDFLAIQAQAQTELDQSTVLKSTESEKVQLQLGDEGGGAGYTPAENEREGQATSEDEARLAAANDPLVPSEEHIIDIKL